LTDHSADVAAIAESLMQLPMLAMRLARLAGLDALHPVQVARLAAIAFLHDIGKANRGFRSRIDPAERGAGHIAPLAWLLNASDAEALRARLLVALRVERLEHWFDKDSLSLFDAVFAHHGTPWPHDHFDSAQRYWRPGPDMDPIADLSVMGERLEQWFPLAFLDGPTLPGVPAFHHAFAGAVMLADWLGSDTAFFPFANGADADRMAFARVKAPAALAAVGLDVTRVRRTVRGAPLTFSQAFDVATPRPVQREAPKPSANCVVLEAETGSGKTEAALWRFLHLFERGEVDGLYFALPTRVAATQMFRRVQRVCDRVFGSDRPAVVLAVPGQAAADGVRGHPLPGFGFAWDDDPQDSVRRSRWAAEHPKRFLAAQIAIGTIDQALLAAIQTRHAHLRGTALLRHLLVVDEVHASDRYMERLLCGLLQAQLQAGGHALLLSATLGAGMRSRLLGVAVPPPDAAEAVPYPALSWRGADGEARLPVKGTGSGKDVQVRTLPAMSDPTVIAATALEAARAGAKVLVIRNTVAAAIATQKALEAADPDGACLFRVAAVPTLHHGRFAAADRRLLDAEVERVLGKEREAGGIVVAGTQTLEVSLDLDADLLLTDLCPVDVLLQRIGRLHRHTRTRPDRFVAPQVIVLTPESRDLVPFANRGRHGLGGAVYDDLRIIEATWRLLEAHAVWSIPAMNRMLVERATHPAHLAAIEDELGAQAPAWRASFNRVAGACAGDVAQAGYALLDRDLPFDRLVFDADDRLATRLGAADLLLAFEPLVPSPFGGMVEHLRVPAHLLTGEIGDAVPTDVATRDGGIDFRVGVQAFRYDRYGLQRN
jgi:CRISPR-associated endonuclease/helicase Cas3